MALGPQQEDTGSLGGSVVGDRGCDDATLPGQLQGAELFPRVPLGTSSATQGHQRLPVINGL